MAENNPYAGNDTAAIPEANSSPSAYCQECGRALTTGTLRRIAGGVYCVPCGAQRAGSPSWQTVSPGTGPARTGSGAPPPPSQGGSANPARACLLGFIPGVGAMYNGQYAKAAMHLVVFVGLLTLADHLNDVFYWLVWGWVFYQVFDAYHTARARRDGLPLPNPFGWNEVGERWGFASQPSNGPAASTATDRVSAERPATAPPPPFGAGVAPVGGANAGAPAASASARPYAAMADFSRPYDFPAGSSSSFVPPMPPVQPRDGIWQSSPATPYSATYTGDLASVTEAPTPGRRFPVGALWLIGLGLVFLLGNVLPHFAIQGHWLVPLLLLGLALWSGLRRVEQQRAASALRGKTFNLACALVGPVMLLTLSVLMALQAAGLVSLAHTWPLLLVVWGGMLLAQRALDRPAAGTDESDLSRRAVDPLYPDSSEVMMPPPVRSTSGTGSLGL